MTTPSEFEPRTGDAYLKHSFSWLADLPVRVAYDDATMTVTLSADEFDSALIGGFVIQSLAASGIVAFTDETGAVKSPRAPWRLVFVLAGVRYHCLVVKQPHYGGAGGSRLAVRLRLEPQKNVTQVNPWAAWLLTVARPNN